MASKKAIFGARTQGIRGLYTVWSNFGKMARPICVVLLALLAEGCARRSVHEPVTLVYLDQRMVNPQYQAEYEQEFEQFTRETGVRVKSLPHPESTQDQLALWRKLLRTGSSGPDVYGIDVVWPGILSDDFIDLKPYFGDEISKFFPAVINSYTANKKLAAIPHGSDIGILFYRSDLLRKYGYKSPPETWDQLEAMAARIQAGERASGRKEFWGFVWPGAATEALTCAALEWQASEGGGRIIEDNKTISVNNPQAIRAWQRAARWVGSISPPSILAYNEGDASNVWYTGDAAFLRNWPTFYVLSQRPGSSIRNAVGVALLPGGEAGHLGTLGGIGLGVSRYSAHPREAIELVRFLSRSDMAVRRARLLSDPPSRPDLYKLPEVLGPNPHFALLSQAFRTGVVSRPSNVSGTKYDEVSNSYIKAVHSVLAREQTAPEAAAALEKELVRITGYKTGPPLGSSPNPPEKGASDR
jgi:trehalose/maltose transport system substrate-binding protein